MDTLQTRTIPSVSLHFRAYSLPHLEVHTPSRQYFGSREVKVKVKSLNTFFLAIGVVFLDEQNGSPFDSKRNRFKQRGVVRLVAFAVSMLV